jgi:hypothetical protein
VAIRASGGRSGARITAHALHVPAALDALATGREREVLSRLAGMLANRGGR